VTSNENYPGREHLMAPDVREVLAGAPERIRVWRGAVRGVNEAGLSWAIDRSDAVGWAHRNVGLHGSGSPGRRLCDRRRDAVIALFVDRLEMEIVVLPEHVTFEAAEDVSDEAPPTHTTWAARDYVIQPG
jgi:hypothetical protein